MGSPDRILLIRLSSVGDLVLAAPVAERLRSVYPQSRITWLVDSGYESLASLFTAVDEVAVFEHLARHRGPSGIGRLAQELGKFELVVDLQHKLRSAVLCSILNPQRKLSLVKRRGVELLRAMMGRDTVLREPHQAIRNLLVLEKYMPGGVDPDDGLEGVTVPKVRLSQELAVVVRTEFKERFGHRPIVGIVPDSRHYTKAWPYGHLQVLVNMCIEQGFGVVLLGGLDGSAGADFVSRSFSHEHLLTIQGEDLEHLAARISACSILVSPDSGPAHMAGVLGIPTLVLFGPTSAERWKPMGDRVEVMSMGLGCSPCSNHGSNSCPLGSVDCMSLLKPEQVFARLEKTLGNQFSQEPE